MVRQADTNTIADLYRNKCRYRYVKSTIIVDCSIESVSSVSQGGVRFSGDRRWSLHSVDLDLDSQPLTSPDVVHQSAARWRSSGFISCALYTGRGCPSVGQPAQNVRLQRATAAQRLIDGARWRIEIIRGSSTLHESFNGDGVQKLVRERAAGWTATEPTSRLCGRRLSVSARFSTVGGQYWWRWWCHVSLAGRRLGQTLWTVNIEQPGNRTLRGVRNVSSLE